MARSSEAALGFQPVVSADADTRAEFIARTYRHLLGAVFAFTAIEILLFKSGLAEEIASVLLGTTWLLVLGGFILVGWIATRTAQSAQSLHLQYAALAGFVVAEAIIFVPLLFVANLYAPGAIVSAAYVTIAGFTVLTAIAFISRKDFSFLGGVLRWGGFCALGLIVAGVIFGFNLGMLFSVGMVAFAGAAVLYDTSKIIHHHPRDRYVGAALELFASVALMFWYVIQIFMGGDD